MVTLSIAGVLIDHIGSSSFDLGVNNLLPKPAGLDGATSTTFFFVAGVEFFKFRSPTLIETWALIWAHQRPVLVGLHSLHEEVGDPEGVEKVTSAVLLVSIIFAQLQEFINVSMPRLEVHCEGALTPAASLVNVAGRIVVDLEHGNKSIAVAIGAADVGSTCPDAVHCDTNASCLFRDYCTLLQGVIDAFNTVFTHSKQEARRHLWLSSA